MRGSALRSIVPCAALTLAAALPRLSGAGEGATPYVKKETWAATMLASRESYAREGAKDQGTRQFLGTLSTALDAYNADNGQWPLNRMVYAGVGTLESAGHTRIPSSTT